MLKNKNKLVIKYILKLVLSIFLVNILLQNILTVKALNLPKRGVTTNIDDIAAEYPNIASLVRELKSKNPTWEFEFFNTGYTWDEFVDYQFDEGSSSPRNLIESNNFSRRGMEWLDLSRAQYSYDTNKEQGRWKAPSRQTIEYYLDPRTYITTDSIFAFLKVDNTELNRDAEEVVSVIRNILKGTVNEGREWAVYNVGKETNVNPFALTALLKQEGGLFPARGINAYNPLNVGATGSDPQLNGLKYAESKGWDTFEKGLKGGSSLLQGYVKSGQVTEHSRKFNYVTDNRWNQYMQNIEAPFYQQNDLKNSFKSIDPNLQNRYVFQIPLFKNMPSQPSPKPSWESLQSQLKQGESLAKVTTASGINFRTADTTTASIIRTLPHGTTFKILAKTKLNDSTYNWYKIEIGGQIGYIAGGEKNKDQWIQILYSYDENIAKDPPPTLIKYDTEIPFVSPARGRVDRDTLNMYAGNNVNSGVIKTLKRGQMISVVGYLGNINGTTWYTVNVDGVTGYMPRQWNDNPEFAFFDNYVLKVTLPDLIKYDKEIPFKAAARARSDRDQLHMYAGDNINSGIIKTLKRGDMFSVVAYLDTIDGYVWYTVKHGNETGYIPRQWNDNPEFAFFDNYELTKPIPKPGTPTTPAPTPAPAPTPTPSPTKPTLIKYDTERPFKKAVTGRIDRDTFNMYAGNNENSGVLKTLQRGKIISVIGYLGTTNGKSWYTVTADGVTGYIYRHWNNNPEFAFFDNYELLPAVGDQTNVGKVELIKYDKEIPFVAAARGRVDRPTLNMYAGDNTNSGIIKTLRQGDMISVVGFLGTVDGYTWYTVKHGNDTGYMARQWNSNPEFAFFDNYVLKTSIVQIKSYDYENPFLNPVKGRVDRNTLNMYTEHSSTSKVVKTLKKGEEISITAHLGTFEGLSWYKVKHGQDVGYMARDWGSNPAFAFFNNYVLTKR